MAKFEFCVNLWDMDVFLSKYAGFCDGVKRAYDMVSQLDISQAKKPVFILGSLVHNSEVNRKIEEKGIRRITREYFEEAKPGEIGTLVVTAHGVGPDIYEKAKKKNIEILDTTCPKVIKVQRLAQAFKKRGHKIILVGDKGHKEVRGINEWGGGKAFVVSDEADLKKINLGASDKISVLSQTTQSEDFYEKAGKYLKDKFKKAEVFHTTCHTTHQRQSEIKELAESNDVVLVIGSTESANSNRLYEIAASINSRSYFFEKASDIKDSWLSGARSVAVSAGASTPSWIIEEVIKRLQKL